MVHPKDKMTFRCVSQNLRFLILRCTWVGHDEGGPGEVRLGEIWYDVTVLVPPRIPRLNALLQDLEMLRVRHCLRLPLPLLT